MHEPFEDDQEGEYDYSGEDDFTVELTDWEEVGQIPVDSGQMMLCDPCYIKNDFANEYQGGRSNGLNYDGACNATLSEEQYGFMSTNPNGLGLAFASSTGWGDGLYPVFIRRDKITKRIAEVKIKFM